MIDSLTAPGRISAKLARLNLYRGGGWLYLRGEAQIGDIFAIQTVAWASSP